MIDTPISRLMTLHTDSIAPDCELGEAASRMATARISSLLVVEAEQLVGIVTEKDVLASLRRGLARETPIAAVMTSPVLTVPADMGLRAAYQFAIGRGIHHLVVAGPGGRPLGIVTESDFRYHLALDLIAELRLVSSSMTTQVPTFPPDVPFGEAVRTMEDGGCVLALENGRPVGIFTRRDMVRAFARNLPDATPLRDAMSKPVETVGADTPLEEAARRMNALRIRQLAVVDGEGRALGVVDERNLLRPLELGLLDRLVAEKKDAETRQRVSEERLRATLDNTPNVAVQWYDAGGRVIYWNRASEWLYGFTAGEALGKTLDQLIHTPGETREFLDLCAQAQASGKAVGPAEYPTRHKDGSPRTVIATIFALPGDEPCFVCMDVDITAEKAAMDRFRLLFDNMSEGVALHELVFDESGAPVNYRIVGANPRFEELTGLRRADVVGKTADLAYGLDEVPYLEEFSRTALEGKPLQFETYFASLKRHFSISVAPWGQRGFGTIFLDISDRKRQEQLLEHMAHFDALTQLPNRVLLADRMHLATARADRAKDLLAVCYMDLDGFKAINDSLGHEVGDRMLVEVAERMRHCVRAGDTVARLGGDEFALLLGELVSIDECEKALHRILEAVARPFGLAGRNCTVSASIGVTLYPMDGADADTLLRHADLAMYMAKQSGRNRFHIFDPEHDRRTRFHQEAVARIGHALEREEFVLFYQPKVDMRHGTVVGLEALIRWQHPQKGLLPPGEFLPLVDETDLAVPLGDWVIDRALRQMAEWKAAGLDLAVSVNVAARHLQHEGFVERLGAALARHATVAPESLELEILETAALADVSLASRVIDQVRRLGPRVALDDFGTGYSSLTYLKSLPVDILKIDQSFVRDMLEDAEDLAIVEGIIGLATVFRRAVIAEGVETAAHGTRLMQLGCHLAQGYGIARPMPAAAVPDWVRGYAAAAPWTPA